MKVAIVCSNRFSHNKETKKGVEIITRELINKLALQEEFQITVFASGDSDVKATIVDVGYRLFFKAYDDLLKIDKVVNFELALISKAISLQEKFDIYHINIGDGDLVLPFARFCKKPILITLHATWDSPYSREYFSLFKNQENILFVSISNAQRKILPDLNYIQTIYNGVDEGVFSFNPKGGDSIIWAGRAIPQKGADIVVNSVSNTSYNAKLFAIPKKEYEEWFEKSVILPLKQLTNRKQFSLSTTTSHEELIAHYQKSKLLLFPVMHEESFGLVLIEAMSCGTPVVAYARGAIPEIVKDGVTGFLVNESENDIRGDWIIKKTGIEGLKEAIERIYAMSEKEYLTMRKACRDRVEKNFTIERMTQEYTQVYKNIVKSFKP